MLRCEMLKNDCEKKLLQHFHVNPNICFLMKDEISL